MPVVKPVDKGLGEVQLFNVVLVVEGSCLSLKAQFPCPVSMKYPFRETRETIG